MTDKLADALKPCPCCRGAAKLHTSSPDYFSSGDHTKIYGFISCTKCPLKTGRYQDIEKLTLAWNTRHEAAKAATPDDVREAFEYAYSTGEPLIDGESLARRPDGEYEAALARLCFKWFSLGNNAALRNTQGVPREVVDALNHGLEREERTIISMSHWDVYKDRAEEFIANCRSASPYRKAIAMLTKEGADGR